MLNPLPPVRFPAARVEIEDVENSAATLTGKPGATTIAFLTGALPYVSRDHVREAAHSLGFNALIFGVSNGPELERAFVEMTEQLRASSHRRRRSGCHKLHSHGYYTS